MSSFSTQRNATDRTNSLARLTSTKDVGEENESTSDRDMTEGTPN